MAKALKSIRLPKGWTPVEVNRINIHGEKCSGYGEDFSVSVFIDGNRMFGLGKENRPYTRGDKEYILHHMAGCIFIVGERDKEKK